MIKILKNIIALIFEKEPSAYQSLILDFHEAFGGEMYISGIGRVYKAP